jgi:hypothetical protein
MAARKSTDFSKITDIHALVAAVVMGELLRVFEQKKHVLVLINR